RDRRSRARGGAGDGVSGNRGCRRRGPPLSSRPAEAAMDLGLAGRVAIVGGAGRGMGRAIAAALLAEGARVAICARDADALERAAADLAGPNGAAQVLAVPADLARPDDVSRLVAHTVERWGRVDVVVNNVGGP